MAKLKGVFSIKDVLVFTRQFFGSRFTYAKRDVVKRLTIKQVKRFKSRGLATPTVFYRIESKSWPNYKPYIREGKKFQRRVHHEYDVILEMDRLSINTTAWKIKVGSGRKIIKPVQRNVKTVYKETRKKWEKQSLKKGETKKAQKEWLREKIEKHKKSAKYLSPGDWQAQTLGINLDQAYTFNFVYKKFGHLYGFNYGSDISAPKKNPHNVMGFSKHAINIIELLMRKGILKND